MSGSKIKYAYIHKEELKKIMQTLGGDEKLTDKEFNDMFETVDVDGSGTVDFDEFVAMMKAKPV